MSETQPSTNPLKTSHPYHCEEQNFRARGDDTIHRFESWASFMEDGWGDSDMDLNLLFRWDWHEDREWTDYTLQLCFMLQRKGDYRCVEVKTTDIDAPAVREWLTKRWQHLCRLWAPISEAPPAAQGKGQRP